MECVSLAITAVSALIAGTSAIAAVVSARVAYKALKAQTEPDVIVYMAPSPNQSSVAHLVVENIGSGPAIDVALDMDGRMPTSKDVADFYERGAFSNPVSFLEPGGERRYLVGFFPDVLRMMGEERYIVAASYENRDGKRRSEEFVIDAGSFGAWVNDEPRDVKALREIAKNVKEAGSSVRRSVDGLADEIENLKPEDDAK